MIAELNSGNFLLIGSILLFVSVFAGKAGSKFGIPALLLFLGVGMVFGGEGLGIHFNSPQATQFIGVMALSVILFSGGMDTSISDIRPVLGKGVVLATIGVGLTTVLTGGFIYLVCDRLASINLTLAESMLLAAVMSSTDSASVFSILRTKKVALKQKLKPLLELESGSNDPMAYMLTILLIQYISSGDLGAGSAILMFFVQMLVGAASGILLGKLFIVLFNRINLDNKSLYSVMLLACCFFIFAFTDLIKGNGYLAVYLGGLVMGNGKLVYKKSMTTFFDGFAWLFQIVMFTTLGLLVNPSELWGVAAIGLAIGIYMIVIARPASVFACLAPFKGLTTKGRLYVSWVGLRGAVPIIFATYPLIAGIEHAQFIFNVVFFITILSLIIQGATVGSMANWLHLSTDFTQGAFDIDLPDDMKAKLTEIEVKPALLEEGDQLKDLTLPDNTLVVMIKRRDRFFVPKGNTKLQEGDKLLVISGEDELTLHQLEDMGIETTDK